MNKKEILYNEARKYLWESIENIPTQKDIMMNFVSNSLHSIIMQWIPNNPNLVQRYKKDKKYASILYKQAQENERLKNSNNTYVDQRDTINNKIKDTHQWDNKNQRPSYKEACIYFSESVSDIPSQENISMEFINKYFSDIIISWEPTANHLIARRKLDKLNASVLLSSVLNNIQSNKIPENLDLRKRSNFGNDTTKSKRYPENIEEDIIKEKEVYTPQNIIKIKLPDNIKNQRDTDIKTLESLSSSYESKKNALARFEKTILEYISKGKDILSNYQNDVTKRLSLQKVMSDLQLWEKESSLLRKEIMNKIK